MKPKIWLPFLLIFFILGGFFHNSWLVVFSVAVTVILGLSWLWSNHALDQITYSRRWHYRRGFPGEETSVQLEISNNKFLPVSWLRIIDLWPKDVPPKDENLLYASHLSGRGRIINTLSLRGYEKVRRRFDITFKNRGVYPVGKLELNSGDLFGFYQNRIYDENKEFLTVFPKLIPLNIFNLEAENPIGETGSRKRIFEDPNRPMGVRNYHPEDEFRRIHWAATARTGELQVKIYEPVVSKVSVLCMNLSTSIHPWLGIDHPLFEYIISVTGSLAYEYTQRGYSVGLISNSSLMHSDQPFKIAPSKSPQHLSNLLESLARVSMFTSTSFEDYLSLAMPGLTFGASLLIVTAIVSPTLPETLLRLKKYKPYITLITLGSETPTTIPGIKQVHMPYLEPLA